MKIRTIFTNIFVFLLPYTAFSQDSDLAMWYGANCEFSVSKKFELDASVMLRMYKNAQFIEQAFIEVGPSYKFNKYLSAAASYRLTNKDENGNGYYLRHKLFADFKVTLQSGNFIFSSRFRLQYQKATLVEKESDRFPDYHGRIKLKSVYNIPSFPLSPYFYAETFSPVFSDSSVLFDKYRFSAGVECRITAKQSVEAGYIFQRDLKPIVFDLHIISLNYDVKF